MAQGPVIYAVLCVPIALAACGESAGSVSGDPKLDASSDVDTTSQGSGATGGSNDPNATGGRSGNVTPPAGGAGGAGAGTGGASNVQSVRVAFFGDQGNSSDSERALQLVLDEGAELLVVLGDFDYADNPNAWKLLMDRLGNGFPWIAVGGNHDVNEWARYQVIIREKVMNTPEITCTGTPGDAASCLFRGLNIVTSGVGTFGNRADQEAYLDSALSGSTATWKVCAWHKNQEDMNTGFKLNEVGWGAYEICAKHGALIQTGHEHAYSRTLTLNCLGQDEPDDHCPGGTFDEVEVGPGKTFVTVSGMGGRELRIFNALLHSNDTWWASYYTRDREMIQGVVNNVDNRAAGVGVLFIDFGVDGDARKARAQFKLAHTGRIVDQFTVYAR